jgi:hypothetical protein
MTSETRQADGRGRVSLGAAFANCTFLVEKTDDGIVMRAARVIPEREAWLYENKEALARVREGLGQARVGKFAKGPSLDEDRHLASEIPEE